MGESQPPRFVLGTTPDCLVEYTGKSSLRFPPQAFSSSPEAFTEYSGGPSGVASRVSPTSSPPGPTQLRHALRARGFSPLPLFGKEPPIYGKNNKNKGLGGWQDLHDVTTAQIDLWGKTWP